MSSGTRHANISIKLHLNKEKEKLVLKKTKKKKNQSNYINMRALPSVLGVCA